MRFIFPEGFHLGRADIAVGSPLGGSGWSGQRESNPHEQLGKLPGYHYIMPAAPASL